MLRENLIIVEVIVMYTIGASFALDVAISSLDLFKRRRNLYFVSMQIACWGILLECISSLVAFIRSENQLSTIISAAIGRGCMINAQPMVLYSRLRLVVADINHFRWILWMIIITGVTLYIPVTTLNILDSQNAVLPALTFAQIQVVILHVQDLIICAIYIREAHRALKPIIAIRGKEGKCVISHLIFINVIVIILNTVDVVVIFKLALFEAPLKTIVYGVKLKLEFAILNKLRSFLSSNSPYVFHVSGRGRGNRQKLDDSESMDYRRRSNELNVYAMINADLRMPHDAVSSMPTPTPTPGGLNIFEPDPFASSFQVSMAKSESRRKREQESEMNSTPDFHEVIRETSSNDTMNLPTSPAPTVVSYTSPG